jgi:hypothetical protein
MAEALIHVALDGLGLACVQVHHGRFPSLVRHYAHPPSGFLQLSLLLPAKQLLRFPLRPISLEQCRD